MKSFLKQILVLGLMIAIPVAVAYLSIQLWGPDNEVEQVAEEIIDHETGIEIDLSPEADEH